MNYDIRDRFLFIPNCYIKNKKEKYDLIKQLADNLILTIDENITPEDIINFFVIIGTNYIKENSDMTLSNMTCN